MAKGSKFYDRDYLRRKNRQNLTIKDDHAYLSSLYTDDYAEGDFPLDRIENWILEHDSLTSKTSLEKFKAKMKATGRSEDEKVHIIEHVRKLAIGAKGVKETKNKTGQVVFRDKTGRFTNLVLSQEQLRAVRSAEIQEERSKQREK